MKIIDGIPRRRRLDLITPAELALRNAIHEIDKLPPSKQLTDIIIALQGQYELLSDLVEKDIVPYPTGNTILPD